MRRTHFALALSFEASPQNALQALCSLTLDNGISNALKHGSPAHCDVQLTISTAPSSEGRIVLTFLLCNTTQQLESDAALPQAKWVNRDL
jgi:two-component sensor histidine kinase|mmetsp:Transcript_3125/g.5973  ORF Transcript_3125/g.5973 Transcript_3125/m.5973 type:complete len:90 (+) Transcript_3125:418-687(+)